MSTARDFIWIGENGSALPSLCMLAPRLACVNSISRQPERYDFSIGPTTNTSAMSYRSCAVAGHWRWCCAVLRGFAVRSMSTAKQGVKTDRVGGDVDRAWRTSSITLTPEVRYSVTYVAQQRQAISKMKSRGHSKKGKSGNCLT